MIILVVEAFFHQKKNGYFSFFLFSKRKNVEDSIPVKHDLVSMACLDKTTAIRVA